MDSKEVFCAIVKGDEDFDRSILKEEFSKFGLVNKIYIGDSYAKVYIDNFQDLKNACRSLNGTRSWHITYKKDDYRKRVEHSNRNNNFSAVSPRSIFHDKDALSISNTSYSDDMEEDCIVANDFVDIHGRPVEVLEAENGQMYVNLDDVRRAGFGIFKKESFESAIIPRDWELREFENYLLNQGRKYLISTRKNFSEDEVLGTIERVRAKLQNRNSENEAQAQFGMGRVINNTQSKNLVIRTNNFRSSAAPLREHNSFTKASPREPAAENSRRNTSNDWKLAKGAARNGEFTQNRNNRSKSQGRKKPVNNPRNSTESRKSTNQTGRSERNEQSLRNIRSAALANNNGVDEPDESWEDSTSSIPKSKPQNESQDLTSTKPPPINIGRVFLSVSSTYKVRVSYIVPDRKSVFYVNLISNTNLIENILLNINTETSAKDEIKNPARNMVCAAYFEDCWYRAVVLRADPQGAYVEFVDYGNKDYVSTPLRSISKEMMDLPGQAIRLTLHNASDEDRPLMIDQELDVFVKKIYDDDTHAVELTDATADKKPPTPLPVDNKRTPTTQVIEEECFTEIPPSVELKNEELVMIVGFTNSKLTLRNKQSADICKSIYSYLVTMDKQAIKSPKVGQLVLCSKADIEGVHRAVIKNIEGQVVEVAYLDYCGEDKMSLKSLRNVDKKLAMELSAKIESPEYKILQGVTKKSEHLLNELIMSKKKLRVLLDGCQFDLQYSDGETTVLLSQKIEQLENPPKVEPVRFTESPKDDEKEDKSNKQLEEAALTSGAVGDGCPITLDDMEYITPDKGVSTYFCYSCTGDHVTLISTSDENLPYFEEIDIRECDDDVPFRPGKTEMCLAKYDGIWYRATALDDKGNDTYEVLFIDFGNVEVIHKENLRKLPKQYAKIPVLGIRTYFIDLPKNTKVLNRMQELIPDAEMWDVDVQTDRNSEFEYGIKIPKVYEILKEENLI